MRSFDVVVVGGGVVGLFSSYFLVKEGYSVALVTGGDVPSATTASAGNLGPAAGVTGFDGTDRDSVEKLKTYWKLAAESMQIYEEASAVAGQEFSRKGILRVYQQREELANHVRRLDDLRDEFGLRFAGLDGKECREIEPLLSEGIAGGILFADDCWVNPSNVAVGLKEYLKHNNVEIMEEKLLGLNAVDSVVATARTESDEVKGDQYVLAAGAYLKAIGELLHVEIPVVARRGHTLLSEPAETRLTDHVLSFAEPKIGMNQSANGTLRVAGNTKPEDVDAPVNPKMYDSLLEVASTYLPATRKIKWTGRLVGSLPYSPDGFPIIGRLEKFGNVVVNGGHGGAGMSLGAVSGKLGAQVVSGADDPVPDAFSPERYGI